MAALSVGAWQPEPAPEGEGTLLVRYRLVDGWPQRDVLHATASREAVFRSPERASRRARRLNLREAAQ